MRFLTKRKVILTIPLLLGILIVLLIFFNVIGNTTVSYYDGVEYSNDDYSVGIDPCQANKLTNNQDIDFVFTEPFSSLDDFENAKIIKKVDVNNGRAKVSLLPGKYGLYAEFKNGDKQLYGDLILENPKNNQPRNQQGPWYVIVNPFGNNFSFRTSIPC